MRARFELILREVCFHAHSIEPVGVVDEARARGKIKIKSGSSLVPSKRVLVGPSSLDPEARVEPWRVRVDLTGVPWQWRA